ncbi:hypothetical protein [Cohnella sp. AR92]|uniref:hypothetical protein n=1 Tax=Cohnella sp. AR92 TaxID=648716 RepID=UPI000F8C89CC|nr:hypothetical protein [Cohnella sp. AR92]RUS47546.1 hypothetical protein ELR57_07040 [Cohnella sp. AR92]
MSSHNGSDYDYKVGQIVQDMVDEGCKEILVRKDPNGGWDVNGDRKLFWLLATPSDIESINEVKELKAKIKNHIDVVLKIQDELIATRNERDKYKALYEHVERSYAELYKLSVSFERQLNMLREQTP